VNLKRTAKRRTSKKKKKRRHVVLYDNYNAAGRVGPWGRVGLCGRAQLCDESRGRCAGVARPGRTAVTRVAPVRRVPASDGLAGPSVHARRGARLLPPASVRLLLQERCVLPAPRQVVCCFFFFFECRPLDLTTHKNQPSFAVLSCHVGEDNVWYDADGDLVGLQTATKTAAKQLCVVCGGPAPNKCGKCHGPGYCSREHQKAHWNAIHRDLCTKAPPTSQTVLAQQQQALRVLQMAHLFPSYEISLEEEALSDETEKDINDMLAAHRKRAANARDGIGSSDEEDDDDDDDDDDDEKSRLEKKVAGRSSSAKTSRKGSAWKSNFDEDTGNGVLGSEDSGDDDNNDDDDDDDDDEPASEVDRRMDQLQLYNSRERDGTVCVCVVPFNLILLLSSFCRAIQAQGREEIRAQEERQDLLGLPALDGGISGADLALPRSSRR